MDNLERLVLCFITEFGKDMSGKKRWWSGNGFDSHFYENDLFGELPTEVEDNA